MVGQRHGNTAAYMGCVSHRRREIRPDWTTGPPIGTVSNLWRRISIKSCPYINVTMQALGFQPVQHQN